MGRGNTGGKTECGRGGNAIGQRKAEGAKRQVEMMMMTTRRRDTCATEQWGARIGGTGMGASLRWTRRRKRSSNNSAEYKAKEEECTQRLQGTEK